jgi:hypothetical protein
MRPSTVGTGPFATSSRRPSTRTARTCSGSVEPGIGVKVRVCMFQPPVSMSPAGIVIGTPIEWFCAP